MTKVSFEEGRSEYHFRKITLEILLRIHMWAQGAEEVVWNG
jgi:hypothetical protein